MHNRQLSEWLAWLESQHPVEIDLGLERVAKVAQSLGISGFEAQLVTVAGTNGKGSFVKALSALLMAGGKHVASYTSPHFTSFNERICIDDKMVSDEVIIDAFEAVQSARYETPLSYFEFTTLAALLVFSQYKLDVIILEVGLGGRLDAVNILPPDLAVITSIGLDHQEYLGNTLDEIAYEKCGILREDTPLVNCERSPPATLRSQLEKRNSWSINTDFHISHEPGGVYNYSQQGIDEVLSFRENGLSPDSVAAAIFVAETVFQLELESLDVIAAIEKISLPGRFQRFMDEEVEVIMDVAHNTQAAALLARRLQGMPMATGKKRLAVFNVFNDKDISGIIAIMHDYVDAWFLGEVDNPRAMDCKDLSEKIAAHGNKRISISRNIRQAYARAKSLSNQGDQIIVFGSFSVVTPLLERFQSAQKMIDDNNRVTQGQLTG